VRGAVPNADLDSETSLNADEMTVHVLDHLFMKLNEVCLVQGGEVAESFKVLIFMFLFSMFTLHLIEYCCRKMLTICY